MDLQLSSTLAELPRVASEDGKVRFCSVYGLNASRKSKRYEVALAIDGQAINIYDVRRKTRFCTTYVVYSHI